ncbi:hypothetical protein ACP275_10G142500 [Erythranthe tilingii]
MENSSEIIAANEGLVMEILLRLPIKPLFRFKCVSEKHTLKNPKFPTSGLLMHQYPSLLHVSLGTIENSRSSFGPVLILDFLKIPPHYATNLTILSFSEGLLLGLLVTPHWNNEEMIYFVTNPTTKKANPLPPLEMPVQKPIFNMVLAFDPIESPHYRVVCIRRCPPAPPAHQPGLEFLIFSSETGSWRICQGPFLCIPPGATFNKGVYWNNAMHYLSAWVGDPENGSCYFKFADERAQLLGFELPPVHGGGRRTRSTKWSWYMGQSAGHLHLVDIRADIIRDPSLIDVYEMAVDYSGWVMLYRVDLGAVGYAIPEMVQYTEARAGPGGLIG